MSPETSLETIGELRRGLLAEWGKAWSVRVPTLWLLGTVLICVVTAASLANDFVHGIAVGERPSGALMPVLDALGPTVGFAQIAVAAYAIALVTPEYASRSIGPTLAAQPRRWVVVAAKAATAVLTAGALGAVLGPLIDVAIVAVLGDARGAPYPLAAASVGTAVVFGGAALTGVGLAFLTRSAVGALCLGFVLLVVTLAAPASIGRWLPGPAGAGWLDGLSVGHGYAGGLLVLVAWCSALVLAAAWCVHRHDA